MNEGVSAANACPANSKDHAVRSKNRSLTKIKLPAEFLNETAKLGTTGTLHGNNRFAVRSLPKSSDADLKRSIGGYILTYFVKYCILPSILMKNSISYVQVLRDPCFAAFARIVLKATVRELLSDPSYSLTWNNFPNSCRPACLVANHNKIC